MLRLHEVALTYPNGVIALAPISMDLSVGNVVAVVGGSGSGKSTLLRLIAGLEQPSRGSLEWVGPGSSANRQKIGFVFQEPRLMPWLTVAENVRLGLGPRGTRADWPRIDEALSQVGLSPFRRALPKQLSGGMAQRVALARALVQRPTLLLLDEPFSALDALTRRRLQNHFLHIWQGLAGTLILVTHDIEEAVTFADRILILKGHPGSITDDLTVNLSRPRNRESQEFQAWKARILSACSADVSPPAATDLFSRPADGKCLRRTAPHR